MPRQQHRRVPNDDIIDSDSDLDRSLYQPLTDGERFLGADGDTSSGTRTAVIVAVIVAGIVAIASVWWSGIPDHHRSSFYACRKTHLYPSELACPSTTECRRRRPYLPKNTDFHRVDVGWDYPLLGYHNAHRVGEMTDNKIRHLFNVAPRVIKTFLFIEDHLESSVSAHLRDVHQVREKLPRDIRVPIAHLCCLTKSEMLKTKPAVEEWTMNRKNFSLHLDFTHVECWQETDSNVENSLVGGPDTQKHLYDLNLELARKLVVSGVPIYVRRTEQMKFRIPLVGFYTRSKSKSIRPLLRGIADSVQDVNRLFQLNMHITKEPTVAYGKEMTI